MAAILSFQQSAFSNQLLKFFLLFILYFIFSILYSPSAFAQAPATPGSVIPATNQYFSGQSPHAASLAIYNFSHAMSCILIGQSPIAPCLEYKMVKDATGAVRSVPYLSSVNTSNGVLGISLSMIGEVISTPPIHSSLFLANLGEQIGIKSAHAQVGGSGSGVLAPIFKLWEVSRNISYLVMILIFIIVGFMVMFRQKLNPQTVVSVQLALPGLVIGLVMITFSYFLAALISDMAFVGTNVVGYYFSLAQGPSTPPAGIIDNTNTERNVLSIFSKYTNFMDKDTLNNVYQQIKPFLDNPAIPDFDIKNKDHWANPQFDGKSATELMSKFILFQVLSPLSQALGGLGTTINVLATLGSGDSNIGTALSLVATFVLIYSMFKLLLRLIQNLLSIIFLTIAAPFYFLATSLPGKQSLLPNWFFNMLCNVLAFPAVFGVFYFVAFMLGPTNPNNELFQITTGAGITGTSTFPLLGGLTNDFLNRLLAFGALVALPSIPDIICRAVGKPGQLGALAAGAVGGAMAAGQRYQGQATGGLSSAIQSPGRLTSTRAFTLNEAGQWIPNPLQTQAGTIRKGIMSIPGGKNIVKHLDEAKAAPGDWLRNKLSRDRT